MTIFRERAILVLARFSRGPFILVELESRDVGVCGGRKTGELEEKSSKLGRTNNKINPHMTAGRNRTRVTMGEASDLTTAQSLLLNSVTEFIISHNHTKERNSLFY